MRWSLCTDPQTGEAWDLSEVTELEVTLLVWLSTL